MRNPIVNTAAAAALLVGLAAAPAHAQGAQGASDPQQAQGQGPQAQERAGQPQAQPQGTEQQQQQGSQMQGGQMQGAQAQGRGMQGQPVLVITSMSVPVFETTPGAIAASPSSFYGSIVTVKAEVEEVFGPSSFTLDEDRIGAGPDVLVLTPRPASSVRDDTEVTVIGHVRPFVTASLESDYDWFDSGLEREAEVELKERPAIVAASILGEDGRELLPAPANAEVRAPASGSQGAGDAESRAGEEAETDAATTR